MIYPPLTCAEGRLEAVESSQGTTRIQKWVQMRTKKSKKDSTLHEPERVIGKSRRPAADRSPSRSVARVDPTNERRSRMAIPVRVSALP